MADAPVAAVATAVRGSDCSTAAARRRLLRRDPDNMWLLLKLEKTPLTLRNVSYQMRKTVYLIPRRPALDTQLSTLCRRVRWAPTVADKRLGKARHLATSNCRDDDDDKRLAASLPFAKPLPGAWMYQSAPGYNLLGTRRRRRRLCYSADNPFVASVFGAPFPLLGLDCGAAPLMASTRTCLNSDETIPSPFRRRSELESWARLGS